MRCARDASAPGTVRRAPFRSGATMPSMIAMMKGFVATLFMTAGQLAEPFPK